MTKLRTDGSEKTLKEHSGVLSSSPDETMKTPSRSDVNQHFILNLTVI